jgi:hypothetical protein
MSKSTPQHNIPPKVGVYISKKEPSLKFEVLAIHKAKEDPSFYIIELIDSNKKHQKTHKLDKFQWEKIITENDMVLIVH